LHLTKLNGRIKYRKTEGGKIMTQQYVLTAYDFIDNGAGDLMLIMEPPEGHSDDDDAKFIFDGNSEGMLVRNSGQTVYLPVLPEAICKMLQKLEFILVAEKEAYDINIVVNSIKQRKMPEDYFSDIYPVDIEIINRHLPIPQQDYSNLRKAAGLPQSSNNQLNEQILVCPLCGKTGKGKRCIFDGKELVAK